MRSFLTATVAFCALTLATNPPCEVQADAPKPEAKAAAPAKAVAPQPMPQTFHTEFRCGVDLLGRRTCFPVQVADAPPAPVTVTYQSAEPMLAVVEPREAFMRRGPLRRFLGRLFGR